jgi:TPR repeat protein/transglutaminase-like putative cysteine protease
MIARVIWPLLVLVVAGSFANAADGAEPSWIDPGWRRTVARYSVTFDDSGVSTTVFDFEVLALDPKGAEAVAQKVLSYNSYYGELALENLATIKADGRRLGVDPRAIRDQPASTEISSPYFDEERTKIVAYSDVAPGDRITGRAIYKDKFPRFPGEFAQAWLQPPDQPPETIELTLDGPASKPLRIAASGVEHEEERHGNRIIHHVRFRHEQPQLRAADLDGFDSSRRFEASTFADYAAFAAALKRRNAPMAVPTAALRTVATEIVGDAGTTVAKVERLHNWVAQNIRYVGIGLEDGGLTSQPAPDVLAARYGDCKAHAILLKALLASQGIAADLVVVNTSAHYRVSAVATQNFDHAIVYVPELDQYLDPTASQMAFGALPPELSGKPALNIDTGALRVIPVTPSERFTLASETDTTLGADGAREGRTMFSGRGQGAALGREAARKLERIDQQHLAKEMIEKDGTGAYIVPDPRKLSDDYAITATFRLKPLKLDAPMRLAMVVLSDPRLPLLQLVTGGVREQPFRCRPLQYLESATLHLPDGINLASKQAPFAYRADVDGQTAYGTVHGLIEVTGEVVLDGRTVRSRTHVQMDFDKPVCPAEFVDAIKLGLSKFDEFRRGSIALTPKPVGYILELSPEFDLGKKAFDSKNYDLALTCLEPLAEKGHPTAQAYLGYMHEYAFGVARDYGEAARWYRLAAEQGDTYSQQNLAELYVKGLGVPRDDQIAAEWYTRAAELDDRQAQLHLATLYRDGQGVKRDFKEAEKWFARAAEQGSGWAQMNLGLLYTHGGDGVALDYGKAVEWFRKAADKDDAYAKYNLGWAYEAGLGVPRDRERAIEWYRKAADQGNQLAKSRLDDLTGEGGNLSLTVGRIIQGVLDLML